MKANRGNRPPPFNNNRGPGGANRGSGSAGRSGPGGPLMTEHLQLQDLDLELALLRRKREIIEQQQTMLINDKQRNRPSEYDVPSLFSQQQYNQPGQYGQVSTFSPFYDSAYPGDSSGPHNESYRQGLKRSAPIDPWQSGPPKRLGAKDRLGPAPRPMHSVPEPLMRETFRPPKAVSTAGARRLPSLMGGRIGFTPNKITKSKLAGVNRPGNKTGTKPGQGSAPNKLNSYPQSVRQNLVAKTSDLTKKSYKEEKLEADKPVSRSLLGRLELALGTVFKDMKQKYGEVEANTGIFHNTLQQRVLKQAIRERIRNVMLGKNVGNATEITKTYRDKYPSQHDEELLQLALKAGPQQRTLPFKATITDDPAKYFKANFDKLLSKQLDKIFAEVTKIYDADPENKQPLHETVEAALNECGITDDPNKVGQSVDNVIGEESVQVQEDEEKEEKNAAAEKADAAAENADSAAEKPDAAVEKPDVAAEKLDAAAEKLDAAAEKPDAEESKTDDLTNEKTGPIEANTEAKDAQDEEVDMTQAGNESNDSTLPVEEGVENNPEWYKHKFYSRIFESLCRRRLPVLLPKYKETIMQLLKKDEQFKLNFDIIKEETMKLSGENREIKENGTPVPMEVTTPTAGKKSATRLPYFVKVLGRPSLPKRKLMQTFLDQFHPKTIKKHRGIHNLLFVGFNDKQDYDNILAATMTVVGTSTIEVRVSEPTKTTDKAETEKTSDDMEIKTENIDQVLNESLDNQIIDLLSSIREEEENKISDDNDVICIEDGATKVKAEKQTTEVKTENETTEVKSESNGEAEVPVEVVENKNVETVKNEGKETGRATPTRTSARIATSTPSSVRTRRSSKLAQN